MGYSSAPGVYGERLCDGRRAIKTRRWGWDYKDDIEFEKIISEKIQLHLNDNWIKDKIIENGLGLDEIKSNKKVELSDFDLERQYRLKKAAYDYIASL